MYVALLFSRCVGRAVGVCVAGNDICEAVPVGVHQCPGDVGAGGVRVEPNDKYTEPSDATADITPQPDVAY